MFFWWSYQTLDPISCPFSSFHRHIFLPCSLTFSFFFTFAGLSSSPESPSSSFRRYPLSWRALSRQKLRTIPLIMFLPSSRLLSARKLLPSRRLSVPAPTAQPAGLTFPLPFCSTVSSLRRRFSAK